MEALKKALDAFANAFKIEDLRKKLLFTLGVLIIYRLGAHITIPGVNSAVLAEFFRNSNNLFGLYDSFTGGAFAKATIFALGIMPYISASIIIQLMGSVIPAIQMLQKEGQEGRARLNQYDPNGGNWNGFTESKTVIGLYGAVINLPENPNCSGYSFVSWDKKQTELQVFGVENQIGQSTGLATSPQQESSATRQRSQRR